MGSGFNKRFGEKKAEGSGRTVDSALGKRNGVFDGLLWSGFGGDMFGLSRDRGDGDSY